VKDITNWREGVRWELGEEVEEEEGEGESRDVRESERDCKRLEMVLEVWRAREEEESERDMTGEDEIEELE